MQIKGGSKELSQSSGLGDPEAIITDAADGSSLRWDYQVTFHDVSAVGALVVEVWREMASEVSRPCHPGARAWWQHNSWLVNLVHPTELSGCA